MNVFEKLTKLADELDKKGYYKEAEEIDEIVKSAVEGVDEEAPLREFNQYKQQASNSFIDEAMRSMPDPEIFGSFGNIKRNRVMNALNSMRGQDIETVLNNFKQYAGYHSTLKNIYDKHLSGLQNAYNTMNAQRQQIQQQMSTQQQDQQKQPEKGTSGEVEKKQNKAMRWQNKLNAFIKKQLGGKDTKWFLNKMKEYNVSMLKPDGKWGPKTNAAYKLWRDIKNGTIKPGQPTDQKPAEQKPTSTVEQLREIEKGRAKETETRQRSNYNKQLNSIFYNWTQRYNLPDASGKLKYDPKLMKQQIKNMLDKYISKGMNVGDAGAALAKELQL